MKQKKQKKSRRLRGYRLHGKSAKHHKGKGSRGGKGMSGTGKRADQKKTLVLNLPYEYFGKKGNIARKKLSKKKKDQINIDDIVKNLNGKKDVEFKNYKILSRGEINNAVIIKAKSFSLKAKEKIEKAGGKAIVLGGNVKEKKTISISTPKSTLDSKDINKKSEDNSKQEKKIKKEKENEV